MAVFVRKIAMEDSGVGVKNQRQKIAVSLPHRQEIQIVNGAPGERPFFIFREGCAAKSVAPEDKAPPGDNKPVLDRAFMNWNNIGGSPVWFSIDRRPTTDGPPNHLRMNARRDGDHPAGRFLD